MVTNIIKQAMKTNWIKFLLSVSLVMILIGNIGASIVQTDGGKIDIIDIKIPTSDGKWVVADLLKPKSATADNPASLVILCPGFQRTKETMTSYSLELARRGIAVITIDPYNQGASSSMEPRTVLREESYGVVPVIEYVYDTPNLNYIDKTRIGAAGYSAGGAAVLNAGTIFGKQRDAGTKKRKKKSADTNETVTATQDAVQNKPQSKLAAIFVGGAIFNLNDDILKPINSNVAMDYALYDEGSYRSKNKNGDMRHAVESIRFVNTILAEEDKITEVEIGKQYGNFADRTSRTVYNTKNIHPMMPYVPESISNLISFFTTAFNVQTTLRPSNQNWFIKEVFNFIAMIGAFLFIVPFAALMLKLPLFNSLVQPIPQALPALGKSGKIVFWSTFVFSALVACFLFIPMAQATFILFPEACKLRELTWWFPQRMNNAILLWAVANGIIGIALFFVIYKLFGKKNGVVPEMWGIKTSVKEIGKTFVLAFVVFSAFYALLFISYALFHTDFRFFFTSATASFALKPLLVVYQYIPFIFIFFLANSIRVNSGSRFEGQKEWISMLIMGLGNSVGLMLIIVIQYVTLYYTGTVFWKPEWLYINMLYGILPMMFVLPYFNRYFFRLTGKVYLGPMVTCLIFVMMMLTSNVCYIPK